MKYNTHGAELQASDMAATPAFTTIAQVESITLPGETRGSEDVATHDDAAGGVMTKLVDALRSLGTMTITVVEDLTDASHDDSTGLMSFLTDTEARDYTVTLANGVEVAISAYITGRTPQAHTANRGVPRADYEFTLTGAPTITQPA